MVVRGVWVVWVYCLIYLICLRGPGCACVLVVHFALPCPAVELRGKTDHGGGSSSRAPRGPPSALRFLGLPLSEFDIQNFQKQMALVARHKNFKWYPLQHPALNCHLREDRDSMPLPELAYSFT